MKIRMKENALRLRVGRSELARFLEEGRIEETIRFAAASEAAFTWALEAGSQTDKETTLRAAPCAVTVVVTPEQVHLWRNENQVGIYTRIDVGAERTLEIVVEKDFACLDGNDSENADTFANPNLAPNCQVG
jgi:hypothetical protein